MKTGEFWTNVTILCHLYNGKITSGPRSTYWNKHVGGVDLSFHPLGLAADIVLLDWNNLTPLTLHAARIGIRVLDEVAAKGHAHLQPLREP